ncbi:MAG: hypothetical protein KDD44_12930, partial [Bdellovibrionales bacterium]|nr:hypothetical protein [Bdellovibrionales bacterium]
FKNLYDAVEMDGGSDDPQARVSKYGIFIRPNSNSNIYRALEKAVEVFRTSPRSASARKQVILLSDLTPNCSNFVGGYGTAKDIVCENSEGRFDLTMTEIGDLVNDAFVEDGIILNVIHGGKRTAPHTILAASFLPSGGCLDSDEAGDHDPPLLLADGVNNVGNYVDMLNGAGTYSGAAQMQAYVQLLNGVWGTVRPCYTGGGPSCLDITTTLNDACTAAGAGTRAGQPNMPLPVEVAGITDGQAGRLLYDPEGRSAREQVTDVIERIFAETPYALTE